MHQSNQNGFQFRLRLRKSSYHLLCIDNFSFGINHQWNTKIQTGKTTKSKDILNLLVWKFCGRGNGGTDWRFNERPQPTHTFKCKWILNNKYYYCIMANNYRKYLQIKNSLKGTKEQRSSWKKINTNSCCEKPISIKILPWLTA